MASEAVVGKKSWEDHCLGALREFVSTAVVIDNEPYLPECDTSGAAPKRAAAPDDGMAPVVDAPSNSLGVGAPQAFQTGQEEPNGKVQAPQDHRLDIRSTSDAFAAMGILCAFVLPQDQSADSVETTDRVLRAAEAADIVVIDWYLKDKDQVTTKGILRKIAKKDADGNGRLRLICVYTLSFIHA